MEGNKINNLTQVNLIKFNVICQWNKLQKWIINLIMSLAFDEFGKPYIIVREQEKKKRIKGIDAIK